MNNFYIDTNLSMNNFNKSINDFNKTLQTPFKTNENFNNIKSDNDFEKIFNSISTKPLQANLEYNVNDENNITKNKNTNKNSNIISDIGKGINNSLNDLNDMQLKAEHDLETFASGGDISVHEVMISAQKSNLAMQLAIQLRNQAVNIYNEFKNMSI